MNPDADPEAAIRRQHDAHPRLPIEDVSGNSQLMNEHVVQQLVVAQPAMQRIHEEEIRRHECTCTDSDAKDR